MEKIEISGRECFWRAQPEPRALLVQPVDENELRFLDNEFDCIGKSSALPFAFIGFRIKDWGQELSPWEAPPVFGNEPFGSGAPETLRFVTEKLLPAARELFGLDSSAKAVIGGYSLAGLFALWAAYGSEVFCSAAGVSPSVWFPGWMEFVSERSPAAGSIYLSLGNKEEKSQNRTMSAVGDNIRRYHQILLSQGIRTTLEWNEGNHFKDPEIRTSKGFAWCLEEISKNL